MYAEPPPPLHVTNRPSESQQPYFQILILFIKLFELSPPLQYPAPPGLLPSLYSQLQRPAGSSCSACSDGILLSSYSPGSPACSLCTIPYLSESPGPPRLCVQTARPPSSPAAHHHPTDVPGILGHGQSLSASLMISALQCLIA